MGRKGLNWLTGYHTKKAKAGILRGRWGRPQGSLFSGSFPRLMFSLPFSYSPCLFPQMALPTMDLAIPNLLAIKQNASQACPQANPIEAIHQPRGLFPGGSSWQKNQPGHLGKYMYSILQYSDLWSVLESDSTGLQELVVKFSKIFWVCHKIWLLLEIKLHKLRLNYAKSKWHTY